MNTASAPLVERVVSPWDKWNRATGCECSWHAKRASRLAWYKESFLDLGVGYGRNSRFLLDDGFTEGVGVDKYPVPIEIRQNFSSYQFSFIRSPIEEFVIPQGSFGAIIAAHSLYYCRKESLAGIFEQILKGLCPGGIFVGNLLDITDPWAKDPPSLPVSLLDDSEVRSLTQGFRTLEHLKSRPRNEKTWHNHDLVLQKP